MRALLLLALAAALLPLLSAQPSALLVITPSTSSLNLSSGEVAPLAFVVQNVGGETAANVTVTLVASGCVQLLGWNNTWVKNLTAALGSIAPGSAKRLTVPVRCQDGKGSVIVTAFGDNTDPAFTSVEISAVSRGNLFPALLPLAAAAALAALAYALARIRREGMEAARRGSSRKAVRRRRR